MKRRVTNQKIVVKNEAISQAIGERRAVSQLNTERSTIEIPAIVPANQNLRLQHRGAVRTVKLANLAGLHQRKTLDPLREEIEKAPVEKRQTIKVREALKHLKEQREKGNVVDTENGPAKASTFEPHRLPEVNAILYGFEYKASRESLQVK